MDVVGIKRSGSWQNSQRFSLDNRFRTVVDTKFADSIPIRMFLTPGLNDLDLHHPCKDNLQTINTDDGYQRQTQAIKTAQ